MYETYLSDGSSKVVKHEAEYILRHTKASEKTVLQLPKSKY